MAKLGGEHKAFVIRCFARFEPVADVVRSLKAEFGIDVPAAQLYAYHPDNVDYRAAKRWKELFQAERKAFLENVQSIGIANKTYRIAELHKLCVVAIGRKNVKLAAELMEQAAKEMGEVFTNKREIKSDVRSLTATMTTDELRNEILADLKALGVDAPASLAPPAPLQVGVVRDKDKDKLN
jgi:hypothetical protein